MEDSIKPSWQYRDRRNQHIIIDGVRYLSCRDAAEAVKITQVSIKRAIKKYNKYEFKTYIDKKTCLK